MTGICATPDGGAREEVFEWNVGVACFWLSSRTSAQREDPGPTPELSASGGPGSAALRALSGMTGFWVVTDEFKGRHQGHEHQPHSRHPPLAADGHGRRGHRHQLHRLRPEAPGRGGQDRRRRRAKLNFYNWDTYIGETTLGDFKKATGVDVNMSLFATNDELFAKLKAGNAGYDVIVPSNEFVTRMSQAGMLEPLDHAKIPNIKNIDPAFLDPDYDKGRKFSMPYTWLVLGIGYRKSKVKGVPDSWKYLFDSAQYNGRIALLSESADLIRLAAKYKGHSVNNIPPELVTRSSRC
jgi:hypothetical protein